MNSTSLSYILLNGLKIKAESWDRLLLPLDGQLSKQMSSFNNWWTESGEWDESQRDISTRQCNRAQLEMLVVTIIFLRLFHRMPLM
jgi:hypothetical protein